MVPRNYKWLAREIESLRPDTDYARIWALTVTYRVSNFMMNAVYTPPKKLSDRKDRGPDPGRLRPWSAVVVQVSSAAKFVENDPSISTQRPRLMSSRRQYCDQFVP